MELKVEALPHSSVVARTHEQKHLAGSAIQWVLGKYRPQLLLLMGTCTVFLFVCCWVVGFFFFCFVSVFISPLCHQGVHKVQS